MSASTSTSTSNRQAAADARDSAIIQGGRVGEPARNIIAKGQWTCGLLSLALV